MSPVVIILLFIVGLAARVFSTATRVAGRAGLSWMLTGLAVVACCVATVASMPSGSQMGSPSARLRLVVVLLCLAVVVGMLAWRASDSPQFRHLSTGQWALLLLRTLAPLVGFALGIAIVVVVA